jgi:hypothetical protein
MELQTPIIVAERVQRSTLNVQRSAFGVERSAALLELVFRPSPILLIAPPIELELGFSDARGGGL